MSRICQMFVSQVFADQIMCQKFHFSVMVFCGKEITASIFAFLGFISIVIFTVCFLAYKKPPFDLCQSSTKNQVNTQQQQWTPI